MAEEANQAIASPATADAAPDNTEPVELTEAKKFEGTNGIKVNGGAGSGSAKEVANDAPDEAADLHTPNDKQSPSDDVTPNIPNVTEDDVDMKDERKMDDATSAADQSAKPSAEPSAEPSSATPASAAKFKGRRKSSGIPEHKGKKLSKKASKAKLKQSHTDAQPGEYYYVCLKGFPPWPAIVADDSMLPTLILNTRPQSAKQIDGEWLERYADDGPKIGDRTFPMMYMHTNEFGWVKNNDLIDLDFDDVGNYPATTPKSLAAARTLAAERHDLEHFKEILSEFQAAKQAEKDAKQVAKAEKKKKKAEKVKKESKKSSKTVVEEDDDVEMEDAPAEPDSDEAEAPATVSGKKRKNEDASQGPESVKKPRTNIKLTTKTANGTSTPKAAKEPKRPKEPRSAKTPKVKKEKAIKGEAAATPEVVAPKEPQLTPEEKRAKKEKEILFLRHKLQKGLLTKDQAPKEEEMKQMSEFVTKLEGYADLEVSIIRVTKINKVLKAILKTPSIPREEEFLFKPRSQSLLDKWNQLLASEVTAPVDATAAATNGAGSGSKTVAPETKDSPANGTNGNTESPIEAKADVKVDDESQEKITEKVEEPAEPAIGDEPSVAGVQDASEEAESVQAPSDESAKETAPETALNEPAEESA